MKDRGSIEARETENHRPLPGQLLLSGARQLPRSFPWPQRPFLALMLCLFAAAAAATASPSQAQGVLTVTPGRAIATSAGTGTAGYSGDGSAATSAHLARPSGIAYDAAGDLFLADANNHVIREITPAGIITTVAGTGVAGFGGDGGPATSASLDTPTSVALGSNNNLYVADSHNHRVRLVANGTITTLAGTGTAGFSGDGGPAASAQLALPTGLALDAAGNLFIADTDNHRVRKLASGTLTTVAGNGEELFAGDGGPATAASLDQPTGVAVDSAGNLYIADKNNHRIRLVSASGTISTFAGNGMEAFSGSFSGDGAPASTAALAKPVSLTLDAAGNLYVADTNNQRIRQISASGTISTVAGTGDQGYAGDGGPAAAAILNSPRSVAAASNGTLNIADTRNGRLRTAALGQLTFASQPAGTASAPQLLTLTNTGTAALTVSSLTFTGPFAAASGTTCATPPIQLSPGASCTENITFQPTSAGPSSGSVVLGGQGVGSQTVLLAGTASTGTTTLLLAANKPSVLSGESATFTATLSTANGPATGAGGSVAFYADGHPLGSGTLAQGVATFTTSSLPDGTQTITAAYSGTAGFTASTSAALTENVADLSLALSAGQTATVEPGHSATVPLSIAANSTAGLTGIVTLTTSAVPGGLSISFAPATVPLSNGQLPFTMTVTAPPAGTVTSTASLPLAGSAVFLALLLFPTHRRRMLHRAARLRPLALLLACCGGLLTLGTLAGCGSNTGFFGQKQQTYNITVTATATDATGGTLTRNTVVAIIVQ